MEFDMLEASLQETDEDHLGVTLIRSGDSVTIVNETLTRAAVDGRSVWRMRSEPGWNHGNYVYRPGIAVMQYRDFCVLCREAKLLEPLHK